MSAVPPTPASQAPLPAAPAPQAAASVAQAPPALLQLPLGSTLAATVLEAAGRGALSLETPLGDLLLKTPLPLPAGSSLSLQLTGTSADTALLRINSLDGKPLGQGITDLLAQGRGLAGVQSRANSAVSDSLNSLTPTVSSPALSTPFQATVLRGGPLVPGSELTVRLTALTSGGSATPGAATANPFAATPGTTNPAMGFGGGQKTVAGVPTGPNAGAKNPAASGVVPSGAGAAAGTTPSPTATPPNTANAPSSATPGQASTGGPFAQATQATSPQGQHAAHGQSAGGHRLVGQSLTGTVASNSAGGTTMVRSDAGLLALGNKVDLPVGARVTLDVVAQMPPPSQAIQALPPLSGPLQGVTSSLGGAAPSAWPTLSETLDFLGRIDPQAARQLAAMIPGTDPRMVANAIAFNQAMRSANPTGWLPSSVTSALDKAGEKGRQLNERLTGELRELAGRSKRPQAGGNEWRTLAMPFMDGGAISQINVITRRLGPEDDPDDHRRQGKGGGQGQRFLIDLSLSNLGDLQFDGLYKKKSRTLELIVRSRRDLPAPIRQGINGLFATSSQVLNIAGGVSFRVTDQFAGPPPGAGAAISQAEAESLGEGEHLAVPVVPLGGWTA